VVWCVVCDGKLQVTLLYYFVMLHVSVFRSKGDLLRACLGRSGHTHEDSRRPPAPQPPPLFPSEPCKRNKGGSSDSSSLPIFLVYFFPVSWLG